VPIPWKIQKASQKVAFNSEPHFIRIEVIRLQSPILEYAESRHCNKTSMLLVSSSSWDKLRVRKARIVTERAHCGNLRGKKEHNFVRKSVLRSSKRTQRIKK